LGSGETMRFADLNLEVVITVALTLDDDIAISVGE
jgi:hypothetical protein